ncbi:MAG TPA: protein kinase [Bryobacteraceae bacterium]|nr:protein kinase [Bryobacteraceae bacterium]
MTPDRWRQIEGLYHAVRACEPDRRSALLKSTDPEIRDRVQRMLEVESGSWIIDQSFDALFAEPARTAIPPGTELGPYRIEAPIGAGGMGTVYRAVDTRLDRVVAIKIASERYSERFQLEARAISTLNHPHICTLYDVGPNYLVMEFIDGSTLAEEIKKGALPIETLTRYGAQIAGALAEAHAVGIVHRDLKPSNIMITRHGVKVLDFGLARIASDARSPESHGLMGTPAYMAPEQVDWREPDASADLFSFGLVLYEMTVGHPPFPGASLGQMLASGSQTTLPPLSREQRNVPAGLDTLVTRLLEKDPANRPPSASEVSCELSALADPALPARQSKLRRAYAIPAVALLVSFALWFYFDKFLDVEPSIPDRASFIQLTSFTDSATAPVLSHDGRMVAFYRSALPFLTPDDIWVKQLPDGEPVRVTHDSRRKYGIAFSPDNSQIAYTVLGSFLANPEKASVFETYTVSSAGGTPRLMFLNTAGLSWLDDRHLLFSEIETGVHMGIATSNSDRSGLREIYFPAAEREMAHYSYLSPDKKWVLLVEMNPVWQPCRVVPFSGGSPGRQVGPSGPCTSAAWSRDGKWIYMGVQVDGRRHLWRQRFPDGKPEQITFGPTDEDGIAMPPDGRSLITSVFTQQNTVWIHDIHGDRPLSTEGYAEFVPPRFSRDGRMLYYVMRHDSPESTAELWRTELASGKSEVMVPGISVSDYDISTDEKQVVFSTHTAGRPSQLWIAPLDRSAPPRMISSTGEVRPYFGPNKQVLFRFAEGSAYYLGTMNLDGTGRRKALPLQILQFDGISPDRQMLLVTMELTGAPNRPPVTVAVSLENGRIQALSRSDAREAWSPDGRYFYVEIQPPSREDPAGKTVAIPVPYGRTLPLFPSEAVADLPAWTKAPGSKLVERAGIAPGPGPATYAYIKPALHANLFRIPLPGKREGSGNLRQ